MEYSKRKLGIVLFLAIITVGLGIGSLDTPTTSCTERGCINRDIPTCESTGTGSYKGCNSCSKKDLIFVTYAINLVKDCSGPKKIVCEDGQRTSTRVGGSCNYKIGGPNALLP